MIRSTETPVLEVLMNDRCPATPTSTMTASPPRSATSASSTDHTQVGLTAAAGTWGRRGATGRINRKDCRLTFNVMRDGKFVVSDEIQIMIEGELVGQKEPAEAPAS
jgi:hypothetical protein